MCPGGPSPAAAVRCRDPRSSLCLRRRRQGEEGETATELPLELVVWKRSSSRGGGKAWSRGGGAPLLPLRMPTEEQEPQLAPTAWLLPLPAAVPSPDFPPRRRGVELWVAEDVEQQWWPGGGFRGRAGGVGPRGPRATSALAYSQRTRDLEDPEANGKITEAILCPAAVSGKVDGKSDSAGLAYHPIVGGLRARAAVGEQVKI
jgi:hypothetical protein